MARLGGELADRLTSIRAEQAGSASVWGGDAGSAFGGGYMEVAQAAGETLAALTEALEIVGENLKAIADTTEAADQASAETFEALSGQLTDGANS
ncbi:MAG: WXG100 family type VII secretion target [Actinomycetota bacterium]|nr:WXG100 family type VII secretion target [Actinomycetota bacterium]